MDSQDYIYNNKNQKDPNWDFVGFLVAPRIRVFVDNFRIRQ